MQKPDTEQVQFINSLIADKSKSWQQRLDEIVKWRKTNRGLQGYHVSFMPTTDGKHLDIESVCEELCRIALGSANGELEEVDVANETL